MSKCPEDSDRISKRRVSDIEKTTTGLFITILERAYATLLSMTSFKMNSAGKVKPLLDHTITTVLANMKMRLIVTYKVNVV